MVRQVGQEWDMSETACPTPGRGVLRQPGGYYIPPPPGVPPLPAVQLAAGVPEVPRRDAAVDWLRWYLALPEGQVSETGRRELIRRVEDMAAMADAWLDRRSRTSVP